MPKNVVLITLLAVAVAAVSLAGNLEFLAFTPLFIIMCVALVMGATEIMKAYKEHRYNSIVLVTFCILLAIASLASQFWAIRGLNIGG